MSDRWPYYLTALLVLLVVPGRHWSATRWLTAPRYSAEEGVKAAFGEQAVFMETKYFYVPLGDEALHKVAIFDGKVVCGSVRTRTFQTPVAVFMERGPNYAPIVYSRWMPTGFQLGAYSNPLAGETLLDLCRQVEQTRSRRAG